MLGYKWFTEEDMLAPGIAELNLNKKVRGARKTNLTPIVGYKDAKELLCSLSLTRRHVISKVSEFFYPVSLWEPVKLQLKLHASKLSCIPWDQALESADQNFWKEELAKFAELGSLRAKRCPIPGNEKSSSKISLLSFSDAGALAGGTCIYGGRQLEDGSWSCALLASKSRLLHSTIPRNELDAILIMAELAYIVKKAIGEEISKILYFTDSFIALAMCLNTKIKLRSYTFIRVEATRPLIQITTGQEQIPLFHIQGEDNLADLITKHHKLELSAVSVGSYWQDGSPWMKQDVIPCSRYQDMIPNSEIMKEIRSECFYDPYEINPGIHIFSVNHNLDKSNHSYIASGRDSEGLLLDILHFGWNRSLRILNHVIGFSQRLAHKAKHPEKIFLCVICTRDRISIDSRDNIQRSRDYLFKYESRVIQKSYNKKQLNKYFLKDGIYYHQGRFTADNPIRFKDLD